MLPVHINTVHPVVMSLVGSLLTFHVFGLVGHTHTWSACIRWRRLSCVSVGWPSPSGEPQGHMALLDDTCHFSNIRPMSKCDLGSTWASPPRSLTQTRKMHLSLSVSLAHSLSLYTFCSHDTVPVQGTWFCFYRTEKLHRTANWLFPHVTLRCDQKMQTDDWEGRREGGRVKLTGKTTVTCSGSCVLGENWSLVKLPDRLCSQWWCCFKCELTGPQEGEK